jgi:hypothetical protein
MSTGMATPVSIENLRKRQDDLLGRIHSLTRRRDLGEGSPRQSFEAEMCLVIELGQVQDRLRTLGEHSYDGCPSCRPVPHREIHQSIARKP